LLKHVETKILLIGYAHFAKKIAGDINTTWENSVAVFCNTYERKLELFKAIYRLLFTDVVYSIAGIHRYSGFASLAVLLKKRMVLHWVGTDVSLLPENWKEDKSLATILNHCKHLTEAPWLQAELKLKHINAELVHFTTVVENSTQNIPKKRQQVLSYLGAGREEFYGWSRIEALALALPEVEFILCGTTQESKLENVKTLGWVNNFDSLLKESLIFLRLTDHDGLPSSIIEALSVAAFVGFIHPYLYCTSITNTTEGVLWIKKHIAALEADETYKNSEGKLWADVTFAPQLIAKELSKSILA